MIEPEVGTKVCATIFTVSGMLFLFFCCGTAADRRNETKTPEVALNFAAAMLAIAIISLVGILICQIWGL